MSLPRQMRRRGAPEPLLTVAVADTFGVRLRGLIGQPAPLPGHGLLFPDCRAVHTFFMSYPIDVLFLDRAYRVVDRRLRVPPWGAAACRSLDGAHTLEMRGGESERLALGPGDELDLA